MDCIKGYSVDISQFSLGELIVSSKIHYLKTLNTQHSYNCLRQSDAWRMIKIGGEEGRNWRIQVCRREWERKSEENSFGFVVRKHSQQLSSEI